MMKLKPGVKLASLQPQMAVASLVVAGCFTAIGADCVITSGSDSRHSTTSLHYAGAALDFRTRDLDEYSAELVATAAKENLGEDFDVVLEDTHLHVEYQPRR